MAYTLLVISIVIAIIITNSISDYIWNNYPILSSCKVGMIPNLNVGDVAIIIQ